MHWTYCSFTACSSLTFILPLLCHANFSARASEHSFIAFSYFEVHSLLTTLLILHTFALINFAQRCNWWTILKSPVHCESKCLLKNSIESLHSFSSRVSFMEKLMKRIVRPASKEALIFSLWSITCSKVVTFDLIELWSIWLFEFSVWSVS